MGRSPTSNGAQYLMLGSGHLIFLPLQSLLNYLSLIFTRIVLAPILYSENQASLTFSGKDGLIISYLKLKKIIILYLSTFLACSVSHALNLIAQKENIIYA